MTEQLPQSVGDAASPGSPEAPYFLLYLNMETYIDDAGVALAEEVRKARDAQLRIVMAHENDPQRAGCEFARYVSLSRVLDHS